MRRFFGTLALSFLGALLALLVFVWIFAAVLGYEEPFTIESRSVLVLDFGGPIYEVAPSDPLGHALGYGPTPTVRTTLDALEKAAADPRIVAVWLRPDGLSASWASLREVRDALKRFKASGKPIIASASPDGFTEQDYYLATVADSVFAPPASSFEFDGLVAQVAFYDGLLDKLGVEAQVVRAGSFKGAVEPFTRNDLSPENEQQLRDLVEATNQHLLQTVAAARGTVTDSLARLIQTGRVYEATDARTAGLLDGLRYEDEVETSLRRLTDQDETDDLRTVYLDEYLPVSRKDAGLTEGNAKNRIAVVYAVGTILTGESDGDGDALSDPTLGAYTFMDALREAEVDESVQAVVLRIDSPGGSATASDAMWRAVERLREVVPVVVSMGDVAASGGYYIAAAADTIVADPLTITGSIGVFSVLFDASELLNQKLGVTFDEVKTGPYADLFTATRPLTDAERTLLQRQTDSTYRTFLQRVADGRGLSVDSVHAIAQGRVWTGAAAQRLGLVDELGGLDRAIEIAAEMAGLEAGDYRLRILPHPRSWVDRVLDTFSVRLQARMERTSPAAAVDAQMRDLYAPLEAIRRLQGTPQARLPYDLRMR